MGIKSSNKLHAQLEEARTRVSVGGQYIHFKSPDKTYTILSMGILEETEEPCVVYQANYGEKLVWIRTVENFLGMKEMDNGSVHRFQKV